MTVTRIRLIGDYFNVGINDYLEVAENVVVPLNFGVSDVRDLTSKTGSFSKSIKIAGTKHNNLVFDNIFDVNAVTLEFNINTKQACLIEQDGEIVLDNAIIQLIDVEKISTGMGNDEQIMYTVTVKDTVSELFTDIGSKLLTDLDFSDLNHTYQASDVIASFDHVKEDGYKYVLPITDDAQYNLTEMKPAVYVWQYLNRIFSNAGYSYQLDEMVSIGIDKMLIPYNGGKSKISEAVQVEAEVIAEETTSQESNGLIILINNFASFQKLNITTEIEDTNGYYNPTLSQYTSPFAVTSPTNLDYQCEIDYDLIFRNNESGDVYLSGSIESKPVMYVLNTLSQSKGFTECFANSVNPICYIDGSGNTVIDSTFSGYADLVSGDTTISSGVNNITVSCSGIAINEILECGVVTKLNTPPQFFRVSDNQPADVEYVIQVNSIKIRIVPSGESLGFSFPVVMNDFIPANIKQSDFLKSIFTLFNLFVIPNIDNPKDIILMTRDKYYDSGRTFDATNKLCKELPHTLTFLPELTAKKLTLTYASDTDALNVGYLKNVNEVYGQVQYTFDNEYIKNEVKKDVIFGASPFLSTPFEATVFGVNGSEPKTLPRIVFDGGKYPCGYYQINDTPTQWISVNEYPFVGHFDAPVNANKDLNFGTCDYYFDNNYGTIPYNNLGNTYWRRTVAQINSGKLYTVMLNVNSFDIANLRLNDKIYLDRSYWVINKVIDYDANSNAPTKFELLSVDQEVTLPKFRIPKPTKPSKNDAGIKVPIKDIIKKRYDSLTSDSASGGVVVLGNGNQILGTVKNAIVIGDNKVVQKDGLYTDNLFVGNKEILSPKFLFKALVTQVGTANPTMNIAVDQFGLTITRINIGHYQLTSPNAVFLGQVICLAQYSKLTLGLISIGRIDNFTVEIKTINALGAVTDALLDNTTIIIESWQTK
jgi:hypothetical protein